MERHFFAACGALAIAGVTLSAQSPTPSTSGSQPSMSQGGTITVQGCLKPAAGAGSGTATTGTSGTAGTTGATGSAGMAGAGSAPYMLTDAEVRSGAGSGMTGGTGTTGTGTTGTGTTGTGTTGTGTTGAGTTGAGTTGAGAAATRGMNDQDEFMLRAEGASVNLAQHVNHQVEIVGRMSGGGSSMSGTGSTGAGTTGTGTTGTTGTGTTGTGAGSTASAGAAGANRSAAQTLTVTSIKMIAANCK